MKNKSKQYLTEFRDYKKFVKKFDLPNNYDHLLETNFESLKDWSLFSSLEQIKKWFLKKKKNPGMIVKEIGINKMNNWKVDPKNGNIFHESKDFFVIKGLRIKVDTREKQGGWDQPIIEQIGYDGGILGIIRKRFLGVPHYLCEAKVEPGNYGLVQLSPTLQATFSNLNQKHKGRKPYFSEYFYKTKNFNKSKILFEAWLSEDGGRLYKKRNKGILVELPEAQKIILPNDNFTWVSLYQIKQLMKENAWINPHIRGILAHT